MGVMYDMHKNYLGDGNLHPKPGSIRSLLRVCADIRRKLGTHSFLFDRYFSLVLDAAESVSKQAMEDGFEDISSIFEMISAANEKKNVDEFKENSFYPRVKEYIDTHPLSYYNSGSKRAFYFIALFDEYVMFLLDEYLDTQAQRQHAAMDPLDMDMRYKKLCELAGIPLMQEFSQQIHLLFEVTPIAKGYLQGALNHLLFCVTEIEEETGRYIMLSMIDKIIEGEEI